MSSISLKECYKWPVLIKVWRGGITGGFTGQVPIKWPGLVSNCGACLDIRQKKDNRFFLYDFCVQYLRPFPFFFSFFFFYKRNIRCAEPTFDPVIDSITVRALGTHDKHPLITKELMFRCALFWLAYPKNTNTGPLFFKWANKHGRASAEFGSIHRSGITLWRSA